MEKKYSILCLLIVMTFSGCRIFKKDCHCPHVVYNVQPQAKKIKNI